MSGKVKEENIVAEGRVLEQLANTTFRVALDVGGEPEVVADAGRPEPGRRGPPLLPAQEQAEEDGPEPGPSAAVEAPGQVADQGGHRGGHRP